MQMPTSEGRDEGKAEVGAGRGPEEEETETEGRRAVWRFMAGCYGAATE